MARLGDDVVGESFIRTSERSTGAKQKSFAESVKAFVVNAVDDDEILLVHKAESRGDFVDARKRSNLISEGLLHHSTGESKENRSVRRLDENVRSNAFDALTPFVYDAVGEANNHQDENDLDRDSKDAQNRSKRARSEIPGDHTDGRKLRIVGVGHKKFV